MMKSVHPTELRPPPTRILMRTTKRHSSDNYLYLIPVLLLVLTPFIHPSIQLSINYFFYHVSLALKPSYYLFVFKALKQIYEGLQTSMIYSFKCQKLTLILFAIDLMFYKKKKLHFMAMSLTGDYKIRLSFLDI